MGLRDRLQHRPTELSGGQQQRVAVARALATQAARSSSPTSRPATSTRRPAPRCCRSCAAPCDDMGQTIVMVTHDPIAASYADRIVFLADGRIVDEMERPDRRPGARADEAVRGVTGRCSSRRSRGCIAHKLRLFATALAVTLGVAFMAGTLVLTDTVTKTFDDLFGDVYQGTDAVVRGHGGLRRRHGRLRGPAGPGRRVGRSPTYGRCPASPRRRAASSATPGSSARTARRSATPPPARPPSEADWTESTRAQPVPARRGQPARGRRRGRHRRQERRRRQAGRRRHDDGPRPGPAADRARSAASPSSARRTAPAAPPSRCSRRPVAQQLVAEPGKFDSISVVAAPGITQQQLDRRGGQGAARRAPRP